MSVQDDARESQVAYLFNLTQAEDRKRQEIDAYLDIDGHPERLAFELKSSTSGSVSTVRDFGPDHIAKWRAGLHWIFAFYNKQGNKLLHCCYASPLDMEPWIVKMEHYVAPDFYLAKKVSAFVDASMVLELLGVKEVYSLADARSIMKKQWTAKEYLLNRDVDFDPNFAGLTKSGKPVKNPGGYSLHKMTQILELRCEYITNRGSTLNNPHIEMAFFDKFDKITKDHAATLRIRVKDYLANIEATDDATA